MNTREDARKRAEGVKADIEKRLGVTLGDFFFESGNHVCDEDTCKKAERAHMKSRSVFGPILIEITASDDPWNGKRVKLEITDTALEALVEKERKEKPLKYDREAERRKFEKLKELGRQRKAMKDAQKAGGAGNHRGVRK